MIGQIVNILRLLDAPTRRGLWGAALLMGVATVLEMAGVGLLIPLFQVLLAPDTLAQTVPVLGAILADRLADDFAGTVLGLCLALGVFFVLKAVILGLIGWHESQFVLQRQAAFAERLLGFYLSRPYESLLGRNSAELVRNVTLLSMRLFVKGLLPIVQLATETLSAVGVILMLMLIDPVLTLGVGGIMVAGVGGFYLVMRGRLYRWGQITLAHETQALKWLNQSLGAPKLIKLWGLEDYFREHFAQPTQLKARSTALSLVAPTWPRLYLEAVAVVALLAVIAVMVAGRGQSPAQIFPFLGVLGVAALRLLPSASKIVAAISLLRENRSTVDILMAEGMAGYVPASASIQTHPLSLHRDIRLDAVDYTYPGAETPSLRNVSLLIPAGSSLALVGRSGAGKTTLADLLLGLLSPSSGQILVDGLNMADNHVGWQRQIGYVPQDVYVLDDTLARNVALGCDDDQIDSDRLKQVLRLARLDQLVDSLPGGIQAMLGDRGAKLSGGQRQRIGIARALYRDPAVLVLDEATSALDSETERDISDAIAALSGRLTVVIIAHRLSTIRHCDMVALMADGQLQACGSFDQLARDNMDFARMVALGQTSAVP